MKHHILFERLKVLDKQLKEKSLKVYNTGFSPVEQNTTVTIIGDVKE